MILVKNPSTRSFVVTQDRPTRGQRRQLGKGTLYSDADNHHDSHHRDDRSAPPAECTAQFEDPPKRPDIRNLETVRRAVSGSILELPGTFRIRVSKLLSFSAIHNTGPVYTGPGTGPRHDRGHFCIRRRSRSGPFRCRCVSRSPQRTPLVLFWTVPGGPAPATWRRNFLRRLRCWIPFGGASRMSR